MSKRSTIWKKEFEDEICVDIPDVGGFIEALMKELEQLGKQLGHIEEFLKKDIEALAELVLQLPGNFLSSLPELLESLPGVITSAPVFVDTILGDIKKLFPNIEVKLPDLPLPRLPDLPIPRLPDLPLPRLPNFPFSGPLSIYSIYQLGGAGPHWREINWRAEDEEARRAERAETTRSELEGALTLTTALRQLNAIKVKIENNVNDVEQQKILLDALDAHRTSLIRMYNRTVDVQQLERYRFIKTKSRMDAEKAQIENILAYLKYSKEKDLVGNNCISGKVGLYVFHEEGGVDYILGLSLFGYEYEKSLLEPKLCTPSPIWTYYILNFYLCLKNIIISETNVLKSFHLAIDVRYPWPDIDWNKLEIKGWGEKSIELVKQPVIITS